MIMNTPQNTTQATARPWRIEDFALAGCNIKSCEGTPRTIAKMQRDYPHLVSREENEANASLIVQAVNQFDALNAVAEAAKIALDKMEITYDASIQGSAAWKQLPLPIGLLKSALSTLATLKGK